MACSTEIRISMYSPIFVLFKTKKLNIYSVYDMVLS